MQRTRAILPMALALTAIFLALSPTKQHVHSHRLLFICFFLYTVMLPGYLAALRFAPWTTGALRVLVSFILGAVISFAMLFVTALFHVDIRVVGVAMPAVVLGLALWARLSPPASGAARSTGPDEIPRESRQTAVLLLVLMIAVSLMILLGGDPVTYTSDSADHIAYIRTVARTHEAFPEQFYYRDGGILTHDIRKGLGQGLWGTLEALTGSHDAAAVWPLMSSISSIFTLLALFCAGLVLFRSASIGLIASVLFVLFYGGGLRGYQLAMSASGGMFGRLFYVAALAFLPLSIERPKSGYLLLLVLSSFAATCTHITYFALLVFIAAVFLCASLIWERGENRMNVVRKGLAVLAAITFINLPYLALRYIRDYAPNNFIHTQVQGVLYLTDRLYVLNPLDFINAVGPLGVLSAFALVLLWREKRNDANLRFLLSGLIAIYVLLFNPLWLPYLSKRMSYLVIRFEFAVPSMIVCAYLLRELWARLRRRNSALSPVGATVAFVAAAVLLGIPLALTPSQFAYGPRAFHTLADVRYRDLNDLFAFMETECPPGSTIVSDPITSYGIPAFTDAYVACPYDQHSTPNDSTAQKRIADCSKIFNPWTSMSEIRDILVKYGADYLVINGRIPADVHTLYWKPDGASALKLSERLGGPTSPVRIAFERGGLTLARLTVCPTCKAIDRRPERRAHLGDSLDAQTAARLIPSGVRQIRIERVRLSRATAARGDTLRADITWVAAERCPFASYIAFLRFDTEFPKNALYRASLGKPYRKILEIFAGHRFRFRVGVQPLGGIIPPDSWPVLREIRDGMRFAIPRDVAPGTYRISLKMAKQTQMSNYILKDILTDDDFYSGGTVGTIRIE